MNTNNLEALPSLDALRISISNCLVRALKAIITYEVISISYNS